jgi:hypothetical protein
MNNPSSQKLQNSESNLSSSTPTKLPTDDGFDLDKFVQSKDAAKLAAWVKQEFSKAKTARTQRQLQWYTNMAMFYGQQWVEQTTSQYPEGFQGKLILPKKPYYTQRKTVNRIRAFVRSELAQFLSAIPNAVAVPATAEDEDVRAAYAAEQAWQSISESQKLRYHFSRAEWWKVVTGNGFIKTWWDNEAIDKVSGQQGVIRFGAVTPFHLFVPDLREQEIDDQPFIINAYTKPVSWCYQYYAKELKGKTLQPSVSSPNQLIDDGYLNLANNVGNTPDSVVIYETWLKPGAHELMPDGGVIISIDDLVVSITRDGLPYNHGQYPFTKFEHIPTSTFYADSPLVDLNSLQREYNTLRSQISDAGNRMAKPQLIAAKGSIVPSKITNEPGLVIEYKAGFPAPQPMQLSPLPQYYVDQQDRVLGDMEDIGGQHDVSRGSAPAGITAGTAIAFLQEADNAYRTPQFQNIEDGYSRIAQQTIENFVQFVDLKRKIKTIGADGSFDTLLLNGADLKNGTDIRVQPGSSIGVSKAAQDARVMDMFGMGIIDQTTALRLLEIGGAQKILDVLQVAERKAQRENMKMKMLTPEMLEQYQMAVEQQQMQLQMLQETAEIDPMTGQPVLPAGMESLFEPIAPIIDVDDFDVHEKHIEVHNTFRMSQEYEVLPEPIKEQFDVHVKKHEELLQQKQLMNFMEQIPTEGQEVPFEGESMGEDMGPGATMSGNGQVPDMNPNGA